jgi:hypothetical protein
MSPPGPPSLVGSDANAAIRSVTLHYPLLLCVSIIQMGILQGFDGANGMTGINSGNFIENSKQPMLAIVVLHDIPGPPS